MADEFLPIGGIVVPPCALTLPRARGLGELLSSETLPFAKFVESRSASRDDSEQSDEIVVFDVSVERPQTPVNDIRHSERLAIVFTAAELFPPDVLALRPDFPWVPHINLRNAEYPRSLCLYDRPWKEVSPRWTPAGFVERIRQWLAATARGELHGEDQPLEPLLLHNGLRIILPGDFYEQLESDAPVRLDLFLASSSDTCRTLIDVPVENQNAAASGLKYAAATFVAQPQAHGLIRRSPANLNELHSFLESGGIDLIATLRERLRNWLDGLPVPARLSLLGARVAFIVAFPLVRNSSGAVESWNFWSFATLHTVKDVGIDIGLWEPHEKEVGLLVQPDEGRRGKGVEIDVLSPFLAFSRRSGASANGVTPDASKVVVIGAGALGSQVITGLARSGFGNWTIVDEDDLLPHNVARHALHGGYVGHPKAIGVAHFLNEIYDGQAKAIVADVLSPGEQANLLRDAFSEANVILDLSASATVSRRIAVGMSSPARRVCVFLNPHGTDLVVLAEDKDRKVTLDGLEAQYYRAIAREPALQGHLTANPGRLRYGRSCRDISTTMSTQLVTVHAGLASERIRAALGSEKACAEVLRCDRQSLAVVPVNIEPEPCVTEQVHGWTIVVDPRLLSRLAHLRAEKLPNETGGVLIGLYDLDAKYVYIVDTIPSPPDSAEWPTLYIRGSEGLLAEIQEFGNRTAGQLEYVGEWHSHPDNCATTPSSDDLTVFGWLTSHMAIAGIPALMVIVGEAGSSWYLGEMLPSGGWSIPR